MLRSALNLHIIGMENLGDLSLGSNYGDTLGVRKPGRAFDVHSGANSGRDCIAGCWGSFRSQVPIDASSSRIQS